MLSLKRPSPRPPGPRSSSREWIRKKSRTILESSEKREERLSENLASVDVGVVRRGSSSSSPFSRPLDLLNHSTTTTAPPPTSTRSSTSSSMPRPSRRRAETRSPGPCRGASFFSGRLRLLIFFCLVQFAFPRSLSVHACNRQFRSARTRRYGSSCD